MSADEAMEAAQMRKPGFDYAEEDMAAALRAVGVGKGDSIFVHSNIGFFGRMKDARDANGYYRAFKSAIFSVIGKDGTLVVPAFSYSFCWGQPFDRAKTKSVCGMLSEMVRQDPESRRSDDANFSVAAIGKNAEYFTKDAPEHSFGPGSFWERFLAAGGKFCNFNFDSGSTFVHYVERLLKVPYRYDKRFRGVSVIGGTRSERAFYHFVYDLDKPGNCADFTKLDRKAKELGIARMANLGKGTVLSISAKDTLELIEREIARDPTFLIKGDSVE